MLFIHVSVRAVYNAFVGIVTKMIGSLYFFYFILATISAQNYGLPEQDDRDKIAWQEEPIDPNYYLREAEKKRPVLNDDIPLWSTKDSALNLKFPKFLFHDEEFRSPVWSEKPKPKVTVLDSNVPKLSNPNHVTEIKQPVDRADSEIFKVNMEDVKNVDEAKNENSNHIIDMHQTAFIQKPSTGEDLVKEKIFNLAKDAESDLEGKIKIIEKTNSMFKHNNYYKLGFIVSYINTTHNALTDLMRYVERNKDNWDVLKILNGYVQIKKTKEFLTEMLSVLNFLQSRQSMVIQPVSLEKKRNTEGIAWSYYDDQ